MALELIETTANGSDKDTLYCPFGRGHDRLWGGIDSFQSFCPPLHVAIGSRQSSQRSHARYRALFQTAGHVGAE